MTEWVTWETAASLVGCPVPTIDSNTRTGRIVHRPAWGNRPTLQLSSVQEFSKWWSTRQIERQERRRAPAIRASRGPGWLNSAAAADRLGVSVSTVRRLHAVDELEGETRGGWLWIVEKSAARLKAERDRWISQNDAAKLVHVGLTTLNAAIESGELHPRKVSRALPSLDRAEVTRWAEQRQKRRREAAECQREVRPRMAPPDDGRVWLDAETAALVIGVSSGWVRTLAREQRLPHVMRGRRPWFLREHVEQASAARAYTAAVRMALTTGSGLPPGVTVSRGFGHDLASCRDAEEIDELRAGLRCRTDSAGATRSE